MIDQLRTYLEQFVALHHSIEPDRKMRFACIEDLILQHGSEYILSHVKHPAQPSGCFARAYRLATRYPHRWIYVEGYALAPGVPIPLQHAWVSPVDSPGTAVELAWGKPNQAPAYLGVPFKPSYIKSVFIASKRQWLSALDTFWLRYPLITGKVRIEDVIYKGDQPHG